MIDTATIDSDLTFVGAIKLNSCLSNVRFTCCLPIEKMAGYGELIPQEVGEISRIMSRLTLSNSMQVCQLYKIKQILRLIVPWSTWHIRKKWGIRGIS
jgi:hypothetical protein